MRRIASRDQLSIELALPVEVRTVRLGAKIKQMENILDMLKRAEGRKKPLFDIRANYTVGGLQFHRHFSTLNRADPIARPSDYDRSMPIHLPIEHAPSVLESVRIVSQLHPMEAFMHRVSTTIARSMLTDFWNSVGHEDN